MAACAAYEFLLRGVRIFMSPLLPSFFWLLTVLLSPVSVQASVTGSTALPQSHGTQPLRAAQRGNSGKTRGAASNAGPLQTLPVVDGPGAGQGGYVHYWVITAPDGQEETQVGIELPDQHIAWSFPHLGVAVVPFVAEGSVDTSAGRYAIRYLYGLRPHASAAAMRRLQQALPFRVAGWVDDATPHCELNGVGRELCMSCMGFVMQVLHPGKTPAYPEFPRNFPRIGHEPYYTTEDLLLYLTGLHVLPGAAARQRQIDRIGGPPSLREELTRLTALLHADEPAAATTAANNPPAKRRVSARTAPKSAVKRAPRPG